MCVKGEAARKRQTKGTGGIAKELSHAKGRKGSRVVCRGREDSIYQKADEDDNVFVFRKGWRGLEERHARREEKENEC